MKKISLSLIIALLSTYFVSAQNYFPTTAGTFAGIAIASGYTATHSLTLGSTATGIASYNTIDQTTNYQRMVQGWNSGIYQIGTYFGGSASSPSIQLGMQQIVGNTTLSGGRVFTINAATTSTAGIFDFNASTGATNSIITMQGTAASTTGVQNWLSIQPTINQGTSGLGYRALLISPYLQTVGSGTPNYLIDAGTSSAAGGGGTYTSKFVVTSAGSVGINTTNTFGYTLAVNGTAIATAVTVKPYSSWPDYVFKKQYQLRPLNAVKTYIDQNKHLPELPSEQQVAKDGINLGDMDKLLVKKVEELTLYIIELNKQLKAQQKEIDELKNKH